jgi:hypothetical protein
MSACMGDTSSFAFFTSRDVPADLPRGQPVPVIQGCWTKAKRRLLDPTLKDRMQASFKRARVMSVTLTQREPVRIGAPLLLLCADDVVREIQLSIDPPRHVLGNRYPQTARAKLVDIVRGWFREIANRPITTAKGMAVGAGINPPVERPVAAGSQS